LRNIIGFFSFFTIIALDAFGVVLYLTVDFVKVQGAIFHCITKKYSFVMALENLGDLFYQYEYCKGNVETVLCYAEIKS